MTKPDCIMFVRDGKISYETGVTVPTPSTIGTDGVYTADNSPPIGSQKWVNKTTITYCVVASTSLSAIPSFEDFRIAVRAAFQTWKLFCNLDFVEVADWTTADVSVKIDDGTDPIFVQNPSAMAYTYFPSTKPQGVYTSVYNFKYVYSLKDNGLLVDGYVPNNINETLRHELGHSIGMVHTSDPADIMYPFYHTGVIPTKEDIYQAQLMYGARTGITNEIKQKFFEMDAKLEEFI